ncbi:MAG: glycosyltransferase family 2 protein [Clostridia bacterium]|nr:glycosyltransferase family 2 protein [Clostridia bacterium]
MKLTIHTATYNRAHTLPKVYESLCKQTNYLFQWVVTDNGSTDNTESLLKGWVKNETRFKIEYQKINGRGKNRAINYALDKLDSGYFFILDSDDYLLPNAVDEIYKRIPEIENNPEFVGIGFLRVKENGLPIKGVYPKVNISGFVDCTNLERANYDLDADMCEAYKVDILKKYSFPFYNGEVFAPEQICLNQIALDGYKIRWYNKAIYVCEYLDNGLTKGSWELLKNNKMGYAMMYNHMLKYPISPIQKFKAAIQHIVLSICGKHPEYIWQSNNKFYTILALPFGWIWSFRRKRQFAKG